ncbi:MAG TPA: hypothetical protein VJS64_05485 [Pyrinomonadaceae bacterium]|nr:hypothetical protein [Pyrinomonadaceae bacterium]
MRLRKTLTAFLFALTLAISSLATVPDQPFMQAARTDLQKARAALQRAEHNKGGHRANAIALINSAIQEVNRGIDFDRTHIRRKPDAELIGLNNSSLIQPLAVDQPNMRAALEHLQDAKRNLQSASADKGGHRQNAIDLVNRAIDEVNRGIVAGN